MGCGSSSSGTAPAAKGDGKAAAKQDGGGLRSGENDCFVTVLPPDNSSPLLRQDSGMGNRSVSYSRIEEGIRRRQQFMTCEDPEKSLQADLIPTPSTPSVGGVPQSRSVLGMTRLMSKFQRELNSYMGARDKGPGIAEAEGPDDESSEDKLRRLFDVIDVAKTGQISLRQLQAGWKKLGWAHSEKALAQMFKLAGNTGANDGMIDRVNFNKFFRELASINDLSNWDPDNERWLQTRIVKRPTRGRQYEWGARPLTNFSIQNHIGQSSRVKCIALDPLRKFYLAGHCGNPEMQLYSLETGEILRKYRAHRDTIMSVAISPDLKLMATGSRDADVILWELVTGHQMHVIKHAGVVTCCSFSADGKSICTGGADAVVARFTAKSGKLKASSEELGVGVVVAVACGEGVVACSVSGQYSVQILDAKTLVLQRLLEGHTSSVWSLQWCPFICTKFRGAPAPAAGVPESPSCEAPTNRLVTVCKHALKLWGGDPPVLLNTYSIPSDLPLLQPVVQAAKVKPQVQRWICAAFVGGDFGHYIVGSTSSGHLVVFREPPQADMVLCVPCRSPVYCISSACEHNEIVCGDEMGNIYRVSFK
eukprot:Hpha_TRINITY_DN10812_c0_g1::TRINITY_DN10812_c0_g1_i1::g.23221::m.23221